jgi:mono/diheme cytochrome c family protein
MPPGTWNRLLLTKPMQRIKLICLLLWAASYLLYLSTNVSSMGPYLQGASTTDSVDFKQIKPIFDASCLACHRGKSAKGGLSLDSRKAAMQGGVSGPAILPGNSRESLLVRRIESDQQGPRMPLMSDPLTEEQISLIKKWIDQGALWPDETPESSESKDPESTREVEVSVIPLEKRTLTFNRDIRPILSNNCFQCHGPDKDNRKANMRLDDRHAAIARGVIVPGDPEKSELIKRINAEEASDRMPPIHSHKKLTDDQKRKLALWIKEGATYEPHWAYITPTRPVVPKVRDRKWLKNPIDAFVLHTLEQRGLRPSAGADSRTLLRRLSLDLTGLPPTPREIENFLKDKSERAYERQVDRLLSSPHYGERMAVPWLDVVRYADTVGYHGDQNINVSPYRDYVIDAFNRDKPFDQFTLEQIAGDLLPNPSEEQIIATAFNRLNMVTREGGAQPKEYLAKYAADRTRTISTAWLGSTVGCAQCHDHKYDPFKAKDFYQIGAFFSDVKQWGVYFHKKYTPNPELKGFSNDHPFPPEMEVRSPYLERRKKRLEQSLAEIVKVSMRRLNQPIEREKYRDWRQKSLEFLSRHETGWIVPEQKIKSSGGKKSSENSVTIEPSAGYLSSLSVDIMPQDLWSENGEAGDDEGNPKTTVLSLEAFLYSNGKKEKIEFRYSDATPKETHYHNGVADLGITNGWKLPLKKQNSTLVGVWLLKEPLSLRQEDRIEVIIKGAKLSSPRISLSPFARLDALDQGFVKELTSSLRRREKLSQLVYLLSTAWEKDIYRDYISIEKEIRECRNGRAMTVITVPVKPLISRVLRRGNWEDEGGEIVNPGVPNFLPQPGKHGPLTRVDLARWLVSAENPLTSRTVINRLWKQFFGAGICATLDDLGTQGDPPTHPELLDWLSVEFRESGWKIKHMVKLMVMSSTYRQSSEVRMDLREIDPTNRLLASQNPRRLEAEFIRDNALSIAGLLNSEIGGPSVFPYQPEGYYSNLQFPDRDYHPSSDERQYRRGLYTHWQRTFLHPMFANFDAPSREECVAYRSHSNTPQQALTLLNDPTFVESARALSKEALMRKMGSDEARIRWIFQKALSRDCHPDELQSLLLFLRKQVEHFTGTRHEARGLISVGFLPEPTTVNEVELAAWTNLCRVVLNMHETITIY